VAEIEARDSDQDARLTNLEEVKVDYKKYEALRAQLEDKDYVMEHKLIAIYEFIEAMLNTYTITKPDGELYEFTASLQKLPTAPQYFNIVYVDSKTVDIELSNLLFNTMLGDFVLNSADGTELAQMTSTDVSEMKFKLESENEFKMEQYPLSVSYRDTRAKPVFTTEISFDGFKKFKELA
jgi:hypothetical protein